VGAFRFDVDGLSTFEVPPPGSQFYLPFRLKYQKPKLPGRMGPVVAPTPPDGGFGTYTPQFGPGHWSINYPDNDVAKKILSQLAKTLFK
jgi:hypothetical protein